jgi:hypothetical protein
LAPGAKAFVEALAAEAGAFGKRAHAARLDDMPDGSEKALGFSGAAVRYSVATSSLSRKALG